MSIKINFAFLAETVVLSNTNTLSIINIVENIRISDGGIIIPHLKIVSQFLGGEIGQEYTFQVEIISPNKTSVLGGKKNMLTKFGPEKSRGNSVFGISNIQLSEEGDYTIKFWDNDVMIGSIDFEVSVNK